MFVMLFRLHSATVFNNAHSSTVQEIVNKDTLSGTSQEICHESDGKWLDRMGSFVSDWLFVSDGLFISERLLISDWFLISHGLSITDWLFQRRVVCQ